MKKGEITVFLSLTVVLLVSFILGMMNAANIQLMKNQARIDVDSALYSLFGEYQTDLLEEYHIFRAICLICKTLLEICRKKICLDECTILERKESYMR